jgi:hypothetical protein
MEARGMSKYPTFEEQEKQRRATTGLRGDITKDLKRGFESDTRSPDGLAERVVITGLDVPFTDIIGFLLKAGLAAIPVLIVLLIIIWQAFSLLGWIGK